MSSNQLFNKTICPRITIYNPDGKGRDSYILCNNGGFNTNFRMNMIEEHYPQTNKYQKREIGISNHPLRYLANGLGRDLYIFKGNPSNQNYVKNNIELPNILRNPSINLNPINYKHLSPNKSTNALSSAQKYIFHNLMSNKISTKIRLTKNPIHSKSSKEIKNSLRKLKNTYSFSYPSSPFIKEHIMNIFFKKQNNQSIDNLL